MRIWCAAPMSEWRHSNEYPGSAQPRAAGTAASCLPDAAGAEVVACRYPHVHHEPLVHYSVGVWFLPEHYPEYFDHPAERVGRAIDAGI